VLGPNARFLLKALVLAGAVCAVAAWPVRELWGEGGVVGLLLAAGSALLGALAGRLPRRVIPGGTPQAPVHQAMAGIGTRLLVTAALALLVVSLGWAPTLPFVLPLLVLYFALMALEVREAIAEIASLGAGR
jgi:hypothetical protein